MNDKHSHSEAYYKPRLLACVLRKAAEDHPVLILTGARQVGKSTLIKNETPFSKWKYASLDDYDILRQAEKDPSSLWSGTDRIALDEVQKSPQLLSAIKKEVDRNRHRMRFVLSGSTNLLLMNKVSESLAGRAVYFNLLPMTMPEIDEEKKSLFEDILSGNRLPHAKTVKADSAMLFEALARGLMPPLFEMQRHESVVQWWEGYVATYLERDLRQLSQIESLSDFRKVMEILAYRNAQMLNETEISRQTGVSQPTVHRYVNLLEAGYLITKLQAFTRNRAKRLVKTPKAYWMDPGLVSFLTAHHEVKSISASREIGGLFELFVLHHLKACSSGLTPCPKIYYWRTTTGKEVDFIIEHNNKLTAIEVKLSSTVQYEDTDGLKIFMEDYPECKTGLIIYTGNEIKMMGKNIYAVPWNEVF